MWKLAHGYIPDTITNLFTANLQNEYKFVLPHPKNERAKSFFVYSCIKEWNCVPDSLKILTTLSNFTAKYKTHLINSLWPLTCPTSNKSRRLETSYSKCESKQTLGYNRDAYPHLIGYIITEHSRPEKSRLCYVTWHTSGKNIIYNVFLIVKYILNLLSNPSDWKVHGILAEKKTFR